MNDTVRRNFRWELSSAVLGCLFLVVYAQFYVPIAIQHGATNLQVGLMTAAGPIGLLLSPIWASMINNRRPLPYVIYPNMLARLLILLPALHAAPWMFLLATFAMSVLIGVQAPAYASLMANVYPSELRGRLMGYVRVASGVLMLPAVYMVGRWMDRAGGSGPMLAAGVLGFLAFLMFFGMKEANTQLVSQSRITFREQLRILAGNRWLLLFFGTTTIVGFHHMLSLPLYPIIQVNVFQLTNVEIGYIRIAYYLMLMLGFLIIGSVVDKHSPITALLISFACHMMVPLLYAMPGNYPAAIIAGGAQGLGDACWEIGCMNTIFRYAPGKEAVFFGLHLLLHGIRGTIAPMLGTTLMDVLPLAYIFTYSVLWIAVGFVVLLFGSRLLAKRGIGSL